MNGCIHRTEDNHCLKYTTDKVESFCDFYPCQEKCPSNGDVIKGMSIYNLAIFLETQAPAMPWCNEDETFDIETGKCENDFNTCVECCEKWLNEEAHFSKEIPNG